AAVGIGFYGNSETNDGVYQLLYALDHANQTLTGIDSLVGLWAGSPLHVPLGHIAPLSWVWLGHGAYLQTLKFTQQLAGSIVLQLSGLPAWRGVSADLTLLSGHVAYVEYYRWLAYLLFFMMLCCGLLTLVLSWASMAVDTAAAVVSGWGKRAELVLAVLGAEGTIMSLPAPTMSLWSSQGTSDFCVAPDKFIMNQTDDAISAEVVHYYLYCDQSLSNPFQQALTIFQRSLTTMPIQIQGLIQYALP
ncbi:PREDICTED: protein tweety homolog 2-like, partial [Acanthisitta chloris]|uniref:protein tweety homolog 2-like n=1 Tax=Acanthisitta chloris TaxID=57068 RepID=UPI0004F0F24D